MHISIKQILCLLVFGFVLTKSLSSSGHEGHSGSTYQITPTANDIVEHAHIKAHIIDESNGTPLAARFTLTIDGKNYIPQKLDKHGLRFVSIHKRRKQQFTATFSRGSGDLLIPIPQKAKNGTITATKGFEYIPNTVTFDLQNQDEHVEVKLSRWLNLQSKGWHAGDEHLHFERSDPKFDKDWLTILDADGLTHAHFLVLKGGNLPGIWAQQYAYGKSGEANDGRRVIRSGEEYRAQDQGHINLLGINEVIQPISVGNVSGNEHSSHYPPLLDALHRARELGGVVGPAHGGRLSDGSTALLDTILGKVDFFEIANSHLLRTEVWYPLLNCGFIVPPVAGTDLPNFGFRDPWQPLFGEVRTYVQTENEIDFDAWKNGIRRGKTFVTSGPIIQIIVNGQTSGDTVKLPAEGGEVDIELELLSPLPLRSLSLVQMGNVIFSETKTTKETNINRIKISKKLDVTKSCWLAAKGLGEPKFALEKNLSIRQPTMAHTGVVKILVGDQPIRSQESINFIRAHLINQQKFYRTQASFEVNEHRLRFVGLFEKALQILDAL